LLIYDIPINQAQLLQCSL